MSAVTSIPSIVIAGPTASGKTDASVFLARNFGEIVSCDSAQVYRYMDIGTGKPAPTVLECTPHHLISIRNPDEEFSAGDFVNQAEHGVNSIVARGKIPFFTGGTGLYIDSWFRGLSHVPAVDPVIRDQLVHELNLAGPEKLHEKLKAVDPHSAEKIHPRNRQRIIRALEVFEGTGKPLSSYHRGDFCHRTDNVLYIALAPDGEELYDRIHRRVDAMILAGWVDEVADLKSRGYGPDLVSMKAIGYQELFFYLDGGKKLDETVDAIKQATRRYAKRQLTWFRSGPYRWFKPHELDALDEYIQRWLNHNYS